MEFIFILVILVFSNIIIYVKIIRPIELLQRDILNYKANHKAKYSNRHDEIGKLQNSFAKLTENLEEEKRKQNRIIASIAHDIKTPLTSVMGYAERLKKNKLSSERTDKYVDTIYSKSLVIKDLIEEFDDYLSYNIKNTLKKQEIKVSELMNNIVFDYEDELNHLGICLKIQNQCPNVTINVDILKLQRLFGNIISNSLKYLNKEEKWIEISCSETNKSVIFSIADNGMGVSEELLTQIFEPMYTSDASRSVAGLGLAICKEIVEIHSGEIWAKNNSFGGLTIICKLPVCQ
jgi:signal transduction histidine kinase